MNRAARLGRQLVILGFIGLGAFLIDAWARANALSFLALLELVVLFVWIGVDVADAFRGRLKAGPERAATARAIKMPSYQGFVAVYVSVIALVAVFLADSASVDEVLHSPFRVWLVAAPAAAVGFVLEYRAEGERRTTNS